MNWIRRFSPSYHEYLIWIGAVLILGYQIWRQRAFFHDDAFISLRYAVHLAENGQLEWNLGERVEGYTNFLQIVASAGLIALGIDPIHSLRLINTAAVAGLTLSTLVASRRLAPRDGMASAVGIFLVLSSPPVALWLLGGLEAVVVAAFVGATLSTILPLFMANDRPAFRSVTAGLFIGMAYLTRPDALIIGGAVLLSLLCFAPGTRGQRARRAGLVALGAGSLVVPHVVWRYSYYGDLLPNTYYAKVALPLSERLAIGAPYVAKALLVLPAIPLAIAAIGLAIPRRKLSPPMGLMAAAILAYALGVLWVGGDHMPGARMLVPSIVPAALLVVAGLSRLDDSRWRTPFIGAALGISTITAIGFPAQPMDKAAFVGSIIGNYIANAWAPGSLVALHTAGSTPYFAPGLRYIDMLGLNDRAIAHRSPVPLRLFLQRRPGHALGDGAYVLRRAPAYIIIGPAAGSVARVVWFLSDLELYESEEFQRCYEVQRVNIPYSVEGDQRGTAQFSRSLDFTYYRRVCPAGPQGGISPGSGSVKRMSTQ